MLASLVRRASDRIVGRRFESHVRLTLYIESKKTTLNIYSPGCLRRTMARARLNTCLDQSRSAIDCAPHEVQVFIKSC